MITFEMMLFSAISAEVTKAKHSGESTFRDFKITFIGERNPISNEFFKHDKYRVEGPKETVEINHPDSVAFYIQRQIYNDGKCECGNEIPDPNNAVCDDCQAIYEYELSSKEPCF